MNLSKPDLAELFKDVNGSLSHKRTITFIAFFMYCFAFNINIFFDVKVEPFMLDGMVWIILGGMGTSVVEHFGKSRGTKTENDQAREFADDLDNTLTGIVDEFKGISESDIEPAPKREN